MRAKKRQESEENFLMNPKIEEISELKETAVKAALEAGKLAKRLLAKDTKISFKGEIDLVTEVDLRSEKQIIEEISKKFPDHEFLSEESGAKKTGSKYLWIIDPLDGTTNYAHGFPIFAISIALAFENNVLLGVVYDPNFNELFLAEKGKGATLNGKRIFVSKTSHLSEALLATGFPYYIHENPKKIFEYFERFYLKTQGVRRLGAATLDLTYVACGRIDGFWEAGLKPWDTAAAGLVVSEAGGTLSRFNGAPFDDYLPEIVASNGILHQEMLFTIREVNTENEAIS